MARCNVWSPRQRYREPSTPGPEVTLPEGSGVPRGEEGSSYAAVARSLAKSRWQRRLRVREALLAGPWLILKGGFFFDDISSQSIVQVTTRLVAFRNADMLVQVATLAAIDVAIFSPDAWCQSNPPLPIGLNRKFRRGARDCAQVGYGRRCTGGCL